jgi:hypothetical protein
MNRIATAATIGLISVASIVALGAVPAFADSPTSTPAPSTSSSTTKPHTPRTLSEIQASAVTKTKQRTTALTAAIAKITADASVTSAHKASILGILNGDLSGMKTVAASIAADTSASSASADYKSIFTKYRVYAAALPQARITAAADRLAGTDIPRLTKAQSRLSTLLSGKDEAKSTAALQADLTDASTQIGKATSGLNGVSDAALAVTPSAFNGNHDVVKSIKTSLTNARTALAQARTDLRNVASAVK